MDTQMILPKKTALLLEIEGHWNVNWGYRTSDGLGYHEYLQLAEDLGAKPLYVVNVGIWHGGMTPYGSIQSWIDEYTRPPSTATAARC